LNHLHAFFSVQGTEVETGGFSRIHDTFSWPGEYGLIQSTLRGRGMWLGCENFDDPVLGKKLSVKVIGVGPRGGATDRINQVMETEFKLIGRFEHPMVFVDNQLATVNTTYDQLDEIDETLLSERMIFVKNHTSMGVTITKKVYQFTHQDHANYFVYDYVFKNDGIIDNTEEVKSQQTIENFWVMFQTRYAFCGESVPAENEGWGTWNSTWGHNTLIIPGRSHTRKIGDVRISLTMGSWLLRNIRDGLRFMRIKVRPTKQMILISPERPLISMPMRQSPSCPIPSTMSLS
jgi:hypothetical protein